MQTTINIFNPTSNTILRVDTMHRGQFEDIVFKTDYLGYRADKTLLLEPQQYLRITDIKVAE